MGLRQCYNLFSIVLLLPSVISMPSRLTEETKEKISQEAVGISLWDFAHKDFDVLNILRKSAPRTGRTILDRFAKDIKFQNADNFSEMFQEEEESSNEEKRGENSMESRQRSAAKTIFEHFMMKGHQRYMYPLTIDNSHERREEDSLVH